MANQLLVSLRNGVRTIFFNRPHRRNAITGEMYININKILNEDAKNDKVTVTIMSGIGNFYSSGNDINNAMEYLAAGETAADGLKRAKDMVTAFINYPKLLIAVVNGPAIGVAATTTALCDLLYATENAYFETPFIKLGLCCEGTSSYMFPRIFGRSKASEILLLGEKLSAKEAYECGFVSKIIPQENLQEFIQSLHKYGELPISSLMYSKSLITSSIRNTLLEANEKEFATLQLCLESKEFDETLNNFLNKSKL